MFERCFYNQTRTFFDEILSKHQCGFYGQQCLVSIMEKQKESVDRGEMFGTLMIDLSKSFNYLHHELLTAKLDAYGFDLKN